MQMFDLLAVVISTMSCFYFSCIVLLCSSNSSVSSFLPGIFFPYECVFTTGICVYLVCVLKQPNKQGTVAS